ncbi:MAG: RimK family alpha-L-glutamate ligase [Bradymonadia bacterium]
MTDITLVTCAHLPEPDPDAAPLSAALEAAGLSHRWVAWDDSSVDWSTSPLTVIRSTWNYYSDPAGFEAWLDTTAAVTTVLNPPSLVKWNLHKAYLAALIGAGVPVTPTVYLPAGVSLDLTDLCAEKGWAHVVVKPAISAGSHETHFGAPAELLEVARRLGPTTDLMVQPFIESVNTYGERSLIWIDGELTHCVLKRPRFSGEDESVLGPHPIAPEEAEVAEMALAAIPVALGQPRYARIDLVRNDADAPMVAELELIEPSLFFDLGGEQALDRYVEMLRAAL